jgi:hypothetical protein
MILFKKKTSLGKQNSILNGEWGGQDKYGKKITSGKRRMKSKEIIMKQIEEDWY